MTERDAQMPHSGRWGTARGDFPNHWRGAIDALPARMHERRLRVLIVDDCAAIGRAIVRMLRPHDVTCVTSVRAALTLLVVHAMPFDAIVCDLHLPEMNGEDFFAVLSATHPSVAHRVIFMSGDTSSRGLLAEVDNERLEKPFTSAALHQAIARTIVPANPATSAVRRAS